MNETHCPYCGAEEAHWNGATADAEWQDLMHKQDDEITKLREENAKLRAERDSLFEANGKLAAVYAERDKLRAALKIARAWMPVSAYTKEGAAQIEQVDRALEE